MITPAFRAVLWTLAGALALVGTVAISAAETPAAPAPPAEAAAPVIQQIEFRELPLAQALRLLADQTGLNLLCSAEAGKIRVTLFLKNVPARVAVEALCKAHGLWYRADEAGIIRIMTLAEFQRNLQTFREEQTAVFTLLYPNAVGVASAIRDLYGDRVHLSLGAEEGDDTRTLQDRFDRFDIVDQRSLGLGLFSSGATVTDISGQQSGYGNGGSGYASRSYSTAATTPVPPAGRDVARIDPGRRALTPDQAEAVGRLLQEHPAGAEQQAALADLLRRQADIYVTVVRRNNMVIVRTSDQGTMDEIRKLVRQVDVPTPLVLLEIKILSIDLSDDFKSFFDYQFSIPSGGWAGGFTSGDILPPASDVLSGAARRAASLAPGGTGIESNGLVFQYVSASFRARLQLLKEKNRVTQLAAPVLPDGQQRGLAPLRRPGTAHRPQHQQPGRAEQQHDHRGAQHDHRVPPRGHHAAGHAQHQRRPDGDPAPSSGELPDHFRRRDDPGRVGHRHHHQPAGGRGGGPDPQRHRCGQGCADAGRGRPDRGGGLRQAGPGAGPGRDAYSGFFLPAAGHRPVA